MHAVRLSKLLRKKNGLQPVVSAPELGGEGERVSLTSHTLCMVRKGLVKMYSVFPHCVKGAACEIWREWGSGWHGQESIRVYPFCGREESTEYSVHSSLIPRSSTPPVFDHLQYPVFDRLQYPVFDHLQYAVFDCLQYPVFDHLQYAYCK